MRFGRCEESLYIRIAKWNCKVNLGFCVCHEIGVEGRDGERGKVR